MYGMLASIGTTKKQIKKSVIYEAIILRNYWSSNWNYIRTICNIYIIKNSKSHRRKLYVLRNGRNIIWSKLYSNSYRGSASVL